MLISTMGVYSALYVVKILCAALHTAIIQNDEKGLLKAGWLFAVSLDFSP